MFCGACDSEAIKRHCESPTCDWVRCGECQAATEVNGDGHFVKPIKDKKKND